jgi:hypothetical protein
LFHNICRHNWLAPSRKKSNKFPKICQKAVKSCQKVVTNLSKKLVKSVNFLSRSCQTILKKIVKESGEKDGDEEEEEEEEEDW